MSELSLHGSKLPAVKVSFYVLVRSVSAVVRVMRGDSMDAKKAQRGLGN